MVRRIRIDSIEELNRRKTNQELAEENERLRTQVAELEDELTNTQLALCDVYELILGGEQDD